MLVAHNPILKGFYPDPSVCRVGENYYLVNSSFAYVPGVPIFHSRDLVNWEQIGNILEREAQLPLDGATTSRGIFAPTLRWHQGVFYMITTNVSHGGNFYVTATNPAGPWSDPVYLKAPQGVDAGIDPSLYFEGDKCYYVGQRQKPNARFYGDCEVWIQELDLKKGALVGEGKALYAGAMQDACWVEGPHLYKIGKFYYITCAEQGTSYEHSVCVARSENLMGPYENYKCNPLVTHRHLGHQYPIQNIGHGDLVDTPDGKWYLIMLGTRPIDGVTELGRETFLAEVTWEEDWPVVNAGEGRVRAEQEVDLAEALIPSDACPAWQPHAQMKFKTPLDYRFMFYRHPHKDMYHILNEDEIELRAANVQPEDVDGALSYIGLRQQDGHFNISIEVNRESLLHAEAGLLYMHDDENYIKLVLAKTDEGLKAVVEKTEHRIHTLLASADAEQKEAQTEQRNTESKEPVFVKLEICGRNQKLEFKCNGNTITAGIAAKFLTSEMAGGFVGCTYGIYAYGKENTYAHFKNLVVDLCCD